MHKQQEVARLVERIMEQIDSGTRFFSPESLAPIKRRRYRKQDYQGPIFGLGTKRRSNRIDTGLAEQALQLLVQRGILYRDRKAEVARWRHEWCPKIFHVRLDKIKKKCYSDNAREMGD